LFCKGCYINGIKDGYWEQYYPDGKLSYKGNFINDEYIGYWEWYEKNGSLINKEFFL
jgi:antitoxin component YwqK of YwqJK toxin-antitoxin module